VRELLHVRPRAGYFGVVVLGNPRPAPVHLQNLEAEFLRSTVNAEQMLCGVTTEIAYGERKASDGDVVCAECLNVLALHAGRSGGRQAVLADGSPLELYEDLSLSLSPPPIRVMPLGRPSPLAG
jgi:hypothetical protein